jgi:hypothetical protein
MSTIPVDVASRVISKDGHLDLADMPKEQLRVAGKVAEPMRVAAMSTGL